MKKISLIKTTFALFCVAFIFLANSTNPPNGRTGAPYTGNTSGNEPVCSSCHAGNSLGFDGTLDIVGVPGFIQPNTTYPLSVTITKTAGDIYRAGFQMLILDDDSEDAGTAFNFDSETTVTASGGRNYIEHGNGAVQFGANSSVSYNFDWTSPNSITGDNITFYMVTVLGNGSGTSQDYSFTNYPTFPFVSGGNPLTITNLNTTDPLCNNDTNGSATVITSGGNGTNTYAWSNGGSNQTQNNLSSGNYMVTVTSDGASVSQTFTINNPSAINASITNQTSIDCNNPTATATVLANGGTGMLTYLWDNNDQTATATGLGAGNHSVTVFDSNQCEAIQTVNIASDTSTPVAEAGLGASLDCTNVVAQLNGTGSDTGGNISYLWQTGNGSIVSGATSLTPTVSAAGTYTLTVTNDSNGCTSSDFVFVTDNGALPTADAGQSVSLNCNSNTAQLDGTASSQGNFSYLWTASDGGNIMFGETSLAPTVNAAGLYTLTVTNNDSGCESTDNVQVTSDFTLATVIISPPDIIGCNNETVQIDGSASSAGGQYSYQWIADNGGIVSGVNTAVITVNLAGTYTLTITDNQNGCEKSSSVIVQEDTQIPNTIIASPELLGCSQNDVTLDGSGSSQGINIAYEWTTEDGNITGSTNTQNTTANAAGEYCLTTFNLDNGCSSQECVIITMVTTPATLVSSQGTIACNGDMNAFITVESTGGSGVYNYLWSTEATGSTIQGLAAGVYTVTTTDDNQCTNVLSVTITEPDAIVLQMSSEVASSDIATDGTAIAEVQGGIPNYTFLWDDPQAQTAEAAFDLPVGDYCVTVTDTNGCEEVGCVSVTVSGCASLVANVTSTAVSCNGFDDGTATVAAAGGSDTYSYAWSSGGMEATETGLAAGDYFVTVTDTDDCSLIAEVTVIQPSALTVQLVEQNNIECEGQTSGSATVQANGGTANYSYAWSNGGEGETQLELAIGNYQITATDANNCQTTFSLSIIASEDITPPTVLTQNIILEAAENVVIGAADIDNGSFDNCGLGSLTISQATFTCDNLGENEVLLLATDINGNTNSAPAIVTIIDTTEPVVSCPTEYSVGCDGTIIYDFDAVDNCEVMTINIAAGTQSGEIFPIGTTTVTVEAIDNSGNLATCSFEVVVDNVLEVIATSTDVSCNGGDDGEITIIVNGGTPPYTYTIDGVSGELSAGIYNVSVTDASGCISTTEVEISEPIAITIDVNQTVNEQHTAANGAILVDIDGGIGSYIYSWTGPDNFTSTEEDLVNLSAGDYVLVVTDEYGCEVTSDVITIDRLTSIEEPTWARNLRLFPNPVTEILTIELPSFTTSDLVVELLNITGQTMQSIDTERNSNTLSLNVSALPSGLYWVKMQMEGEVVVRKVMVD